MLFRTSLYFVRLKVFLYLFSEVAYLPSASIAIDTRSSQELATSQEPDDAEPDAFLKIPTELEAIAMLESEYLAECGRTGLPSGPEIITSIDTSGNKTSRQTKGVLAMLKQVRSRKVANKQESEISCYLNEDHADDNQCVLQYWKEKSKKFPVLGNIAKRFLAIPATSGGVERVFSITGSLARARRARLRPKQLEDIILLREYRRPVLLKRLQQANKIIGIKKV